jgi:nitroreductase
MAAMAAPSARNNQPWEFVVVTDPAMRQKIATVHPNAKFAAQAGVVFFLVGDPSVRLMEQSLSAATQNLLLAATALGLGSCWLGVGENRQAPMQQIVEVPSSKLVVSMVCVGYPAEEKEARTNYDPGKVHWEKYHSSTD